MRAVEGWLYNCYVMVTASVVIYFKVVHLVNNVPLHTLLYLRLKYNSEEFVL